MSLIRNRLYLKKAKHRWALAVTKGQVEQA